MINTDTPQLNSPYPSIADTIAALAPGKALIAGLSLKDKGIDVVIRV